MPSLDRARRHLKALEAGAIRHVGTDLGSHLTGVCELLEQWGRPQVLCLAGLFHAVYGNDGFPHPLIRLESRHDVAEMIGAEAEALVYFYAACDRRFTYAQMLAKRHPAYRDRFTGETFLPPAQSLAAFCEMTLANELEIARRDPEFRDRNARRFVRLFRRLASRVSPEALKCATEVYPALARTPSALEPILCLAASWRMRPRSPKWFPSSR